VDEFVIIILLFT